MVKAISAGLLMYRKRNNELEVLLVHPGGPYFKHKDNGYWGIPKGSVNDGEELIDAARREFEEETGIKMNGNELLSLGEIKQKGGKIVHGWAFEGEWSGILVSNYFSMEFPIKSGKFISVPEVDRAGWFGIEDAKKKMNQAQTTFLDRLSDHLQ